MKPELIATMTAFLVTGCTVDRDFLSRVDGGPGPASSGGTPADPGGSASGGRAATAGTGGLSGTGGASTVDRTCESLPTGTGEANNPCGLRGALQATYSPDGQLLGVARDGSPPNIHLWRLRDGALLRSMGTSPGTLQVAFSPDGRMLASAGWGDGDGYSGDVHPNIVNVWDVATGALVRALPATCGQLSDSIAFSHDGAWLVTAGLVGPVEVWRTSDWTRVAAIPYSTNVYSVHFSSDDSMLIMTGTDARTTIWSLPTGTLVLTLPASAYHWPRDADFSPNGQRIVNQDPDNAIRIWDTAAVTEVQTLTGPTGYMTAAVWIDDNRLVTADWGATSNVILWEVSAGTFAQVKTWTLGLGGVSAVAVSPDHTQLAVSYGGIEFLSL
jgi:WD40 repeat protein